MGHRFSKINSKNISISPLLSFQSPTQEQTCMKNISSTLKKIESHISLLKEKYLIYPYIFLVISIIYILLYFHTIVVPGNQFDTHPLGWWGWFDQGVYLKNARNMAQWQFPQEFWYPVLYPALGALFLSFSPGHPFFLINWACLLWFCYVFIRIAEQYFTRIWVLFILFGTTICQPRIFEQFITPWTTTLCVALLSTGFLALLWLDEVNKGIRQKLYIWQIFLVSLSLGLVIATRPQDTIIGVVISLFFFIKWLELKKQKKAIPGWIALFTTAIIGACIGPILYLGHRYLISHSFEALYAFGGASLSDILPLADIPEKFISLWLDGYSIYGEEHSGLLLQFPWLFISLSGLFWVLLSKNFILRCIATAIIVSFCFIYLPFFDLLPTGLWRFSNVHYFKWTFPYFGLFAFCVLHSVIKRKNRLALIILVSIPIILSSLHFNIRYMPITFNQKENIIFAELPNQKIDFIDILFHKTYDYVGVYSCVTQITIDQKTLTPLQTRLVPLKKGIRIIFVRPIQGQTLQVTLQPNNAPLNMIGFGGIYTIALSVPHAPSSAPPIYPAIEENAFLPGTLPPFPLFEKKVGYDLKPYSVVFAFGWSFVEEWGIWSDGEHAELFLTLPSNAHELVLYGHPFTGTGHPYQRLIIKINREEVYNETLKMREYQITLPLSDKMINSGLLHIEFELPDAFSPSSIHMNNDKRKLGFGLTALLLR